MKTTILIADDNAGMRAVLRANLEKLGHQVLEAGDGSEAVSVLRSKQADIVISDLRMPNMDGHALLAHVREHYPDVLFIMISAHGSVKDAVEAVKNGAADYLTKPFEFSEIEQVIRRAENLVDESSDARLPLGSGIDAMVGQGAAMENVRELIRTVSGADSTVLILGESGTGKELAARAIHDLGARKKGPFIAANCAAFGEGVLESELFGHEKGAFTGAASLRVGRFELAHKGTLFLDEIGDLNPAIQVKLLRVLQERAFERVGGVKKIRSDFRLIAATNRDLAEEVKKGAFRQDLFFRLNVIPLFLPPLRNRREDIPLLASHFVRLFNRKLGKRMSCVRADAMAALSAYAWPGNIRELENVMERSMVFAKGAEVTPADLPGHLAAAPQAENAATAAPLPDRPLKDALRTSISSIEKDYIIAALREEGSNRTNAAKRLGISRKGLQLKIKEYGLEQY